MKTEDLIRALAEDRQGGRDPGRTLTLALLAGAVVSGLAFFLTLGPRSDVAQALETVRFPFKFVVTLTLLATAAAIAWRVGRPGVPLFPLGWLVLLAPALLALAVLLELLVMPSGQWDTLLVGTNALHCLLSIPLLSLPVLACVLYAMREGAPSSPTMAGALAGLVSAAVGATYYAANCTDDSPLFVATWYTMAIVIVVTAGALAGSRLLRW